MDVFPKGLNPVTFPPRIASLPRDARGYPIPRFVLMRETGPDFALTNPEHWLRCVKTRCCWICGEPCGQYLAFVCGPSAAFTGLSSEPGGHRECAEFALRTCPFILFPKRTRVDVDLPADWQSTSVVTSDINPGIWLLWVTKTYRVQPIADTAVVAPGEPTFHRWYYRGGDATDQQVSDALTSYGHRFGLSNPKWSPEELLAKLAVCRERFPCKLTKLGE